MKTAIVYASISGNNRLLAKHLASRLEAPVEEIRDTRWFKKLRLVSDLAKNRLAPIAPIMLDPTRFDHVVFVAPVFGSTIAPAMKTALSSWGRIVGAYSFVTLCGYRNEEQRGKIHAQLVELTGREPANVREIVVGDLVPEKDRKSIWVVSNYRVRAAELSRFKAEIDEILAWFA